MSLTPTLKTTIKDAIKGYIDTTLKFETLYVPAPYLPDDFIIKAIEKRNKFKNDEWLIDALQEVAEEYIKTEDGIEWYLCAKDEYEDDMFGDFLEYIKHDKDINEYLSNHPQEGKIDNVRGWFYNKELSEYKGVEIDIPATLKNAFNDEFMFLPIIRFFNDDYPEFFEENKDCYDGKLDGVEGVCIIDFYRYHKTGDYKPLIQFIDWLYDGNRDESKWSKFFPDGIEDDYESDAGPNIFKRAKSFTIDGVYFIYEDEDDYALPEGYKQKVVLKDE